MAVYESGLIELIGIASEFPENPEHFKQLSVQDNMRIPAAKPDIEQLISVGAEIEITDYHVIKTPEGSSKEGQRLTGLKIIVEGKVCQKVEYVADEPEQSVHAAHFYMPFSTYIVIPSCYIDGTPITITGYIEDIYVKLQDKRSIFKNVTILLDARY